MNVMCIYLENSFYGVFKSFYNLVYIIFGEFCLNLLKAIFIPCLNYGEFGDFILVNLYSMF